MIRKHTLSLGVLGVMALVCAGLPTMARGDAADQPQEKRAEGTPADTQVASSGDQYRYLSDGGWDDVSQTAVRFGYWGTSSSGSPVLTGQYQDLGASPFYDIDGIRSDGERTFNYTITGTDAESNNVNFNFYRPGVQVNANYIRFPHQLGHTNLGEFPNYNVTGAQQFRRQDLNPGEDYAIRVQELKSNFKWQVNDNLKVRLDVWGIYKEGEREARAGQECYAHNSGVVADATPGKNCHVLSQMQHINWQTTEVKPVIEMKAGPIVAEYSRPIRVFAQGDQVVSRLYDSGGTAAGEFGSARYMEYAVVPNSITQIDQLKLSADVSENNKVYGFLFAGNTRKESDIVPPTPPAGAAYTFVQPDGDQRISYRQFNGADVRWTNTSIDNVTITTYGRTEQENNEPAAFVIPGEETRNGQVGGTSNPTEHDPTLAENAPLNYQRNQVGSKALWRPFGRGFGLGGLAINGGYEYSTIQRQTLELDVGGDDPPFISQVNQDDTRTHMFSIGPSVRWSTELDTYVRYKWANTDHPLFAANAFSNANYTAVAVNSALPTHDDYIEIGGTLMPTDRFMLMGWIGVDIQSQHGGYDFVHNQPGKTTVTNLDKTSGFDSQSFPFGVNGSYRVTDLWTLNGGAAYYTNFITQDVALGAGLDHTTTNSGSGAGLITYGLLANEWGYVSRASVFNLGSSYDITPRIRLVGQAEYVRGLQTASLLSGDPRYPAVNTTLAGVPSYFRQDIATTRLSMGVDYKLSSRWSTYVRYVLYDVNDVANQQTFAASTPPVTGLPTSGTSNMFLGGLTGMF